jgi:cytidine deaminase
MKQINAELLESLREQAARVAEQAYSPYSRFKVGAAVLDLEGRVFVGCNVENASFGLTQCAERNAIAAAVAGGAEAGNLTVLVIYVPGQLALPPCGACRQVMHEMMAADSLVIACCDGQDSKTWSPQQYLPDAFDFHDY